MLNSYLNLQLQDFLDIVSGERDKTKHTLIIRIRDGEGEAGLQKGELTGTLEQLEDLAFEYSPSRISDEIRKCVEKIKQYSVYQFDDFSNIEIYNYLEYTTSNFEAGKVKRIWFDVDCYYHLTYLEHLNDEATDKYIENGWEIPYVEIEDKLTGSPMRLTDYRTMRSRARVGYDGYSMAYLRSVLKSKMNADDTDRYHLFFKSLSEYVDGDEHVFSYAITHKNPYNNKKLTWIGSSCEAIVFADHLGLSVSQFNKCFVLSNGKELKESNRGRKLKSEYPIFEILQKWSPY